jgi:hypothetical protein
MKVNINKYDKVWITNFFSHVAINLAKFGDSLKSSIILARLSAIQQGRRCS